MDMRQLLEKAYGKENVTLLGLNDAGSALMYLIRRFGYTEHGSDPHKQICKYVIPTNHELVSVVVSFGGTYAMIDASLRDPLFMEYENELRAPYQAWHERCRNWAEQNGFVFSGEFIPTEEDEEIRARYRKVEPFPDESDPEPGTIRYEVETAVLECLSDLLRPVFVRDVPINVLGRYDGEVGEWLEDEERYENAVSYHWSAGTGIVHEVYKDYDLLMYLFDALRQKGDGDLEQGMKEVVRSVANSERRI